MHRCHRLPWEVTSRACPHYWAGEDHDGLNDEATCQGLTSEDTGTQRPDGLSPLFASCLDIDVLAEAALSGQEKEPQVGLTWSWRPVERELRAVSLFGAAQHEHGLVTLALWVPSSLSVTET